LVSNIGGSLGLFIGLSFVSLFEIFEILMEIVFTVIRRNKKLQNQNGTTIYMETRRKSNSEQ